MLSQLKIKNLEQEIAELKSSVPGSDMAKQSVYYVLEYKIGNQVTFSEFRDAIITADMITRTERDFQNNREYYYILLQTKANYIFIGLLKDYVDGDDREVIKLIDGKGGKPTEEDLNKMITGSPCRYNEFKFNWPEIHGHTWDLTCDVVYDSECKIKKKLPKNLSTVEKLILNGKP